MKDAQGLFGLTVRRPVAALVFFATMLVVGGIAYRDVPLKLLPSGWAEAQLNLWIPTPNSSAQENEEKVARVIEKDGTERPVLLSLEGLAAHHEGLVAHDHVIE